MSLTSFLKQKDVKEKFKQTFAKPKVNISKELLAPPLTTNYGTVGTAFDYLLRFWLEHQYPFSKSRAWIAQLAFLSFERGGRLVSICDSIVEEAKQHHQLFLQNGLLTDDLLRSCLQLAQLDAIFRRNAPIPNLGHVDENDIFDLRQLIQVVKLNFSP